MKQFDTWWNAHQASLTGNYEEYKDAFREGMLMAADIAWKKGIPSKKIQHGFDEGYDKATEDCHNSIKEMAAQL